MRTIVSSQRRNHAVLHTARRVRAAKTVVCDYRAARVAETNYVRREHICLDLIPESQQACLPYAVRFRSGSLGGCRHAYP